MKKGIGLRIVDFQKRLFERHWESRIKKKKESWIARQNYKYPLLYEILATFIHFPDFNERRRFGKIDVGSNNGSILELGCGTGRTSAVLAGKGIKAVNLDICERFLDYGKNKGRITYPVAGSAYQLCFSDNVFDKIIIPDAFHHILDHEQLFSECFRVLKHDGELIFFEIVWANYASNKIIKDVLDGTIWNLDIEGFRSKLDVLSDKHKFKLRDFTVTNREITYIGLMGCLDVIAKLEKV